MDIILRQEEMDTSSPVPLCGICNKNNYKYVCPRCNILYCSVPCYKSQYHLDCSEAFYKESITEYLKAEGRDSESKKRMEEILRRVNMGEEGEEDFDSEDSDDIEDMEERLRGIDLNDADSVWERLTEEEKKEFSEFVRNGDVTTLIPPWEPWWSERHLRPKVRFADDDSEEPYKSNCPRPRIVPNLSSITKVEPSPLILFNILNAIAGYTLVTRYYNGNFENLLLEAATLLLNLAKTLSANECHQSIDMATASVAEAATSCSWINIGNENIQQMKVDVLKILQGPNDDEPDYYFKAALADIHSLLTSAKKQKQPLNGNRVTKSKFSQSFPETSTNAISFASKESISKCIKKIEFYESWTAERFKSVADMQKSE